MDAPLSSQMDIVLQFHLIYQRKSVREHQNLLAPETGRWTITYRSLDAIVMITRF